MSENCTFLDSQDSRWQRKNTRKKPPLSYTQEATTGNTVKPEEDLKTAGQTPYTGEGEETTQKKVKCQSCD